MGNSHQGNSIPNIKDVITVAVGESSGLPLTKYLLIQYGNKHSSGFQLLAALLPLGQYTAEYVVIATMKSFIYVVVTLTAV